MVAGAIFAGAIVPEPMHVTKIGLPSAVVQDFGSLFDALYLPQEDFDKLCSGETEASLDVPPKSWWWCIVKLE